MERPNYYSGKALGEADFTNEQEYRKSRDRPQGEEKAAMPAAVRNDPYKNFNFVVEIDGVSVAGFVECTGLESETEVIEYREGSEPATVRKLPGLTKFSNIVLSRGVTDSKELYEWRKKVIDGEVERRSGSIVLLNDRREQVARWNFKQGWPCRLSGPDLYALECDVAIEELEICHEGLERE